MTGTDFWNYSLSRYGRSGVPSLCLTLQDRHGADVNLVLFALWLGSRRLAIRDAARIKDAVEAWHRNAVVPLRGVRRWLKGRDFPDPQARDALRAAIQKSELEAERLEQSVLQGLFDADRDSLFSEADGDEQETMAANAKVFCRDDAEGNAPDPEIAELVALCL